MLEFTNLIDIWRLQTLFDNFSKLTGIAVSVLDTQGNIIVSSTWKDICLNFHRKHPDTKTLCEMSDAQCMERLQPGDSYVIYTCCNNLIHIGAPVYIDGNHVATIYGSQFFLKAPNLEFFKAQAEQYGFDKKTYIEALQQVPVKTHEQVKKYVDFLCEYVKIASEIGQITLGHYREYQRAENNYEELSDVYGQLAATEMVLKTQYSELVKSQQDLKGSEERYRLALEGANDLLYDWELSQNTIYLSDKYTELFDGNVKSNFITDTEFLSYIHPEDYRSVIDAFNTHLAGYTPYFKCEYRILIGEREKWILCRGKALYGETGQAIRMAGSISDVSDRKCYEKQVQKLAYYDTLTNLPNRNCFMEKLQEELAYARITASKGAILFIDLDNFKTMNDTFGHDHGDAILRFFGEKLRQCVPKGGFLCRFGGDEFLILLPCVHGEGDVINTVHNILALFDSVYTIQGINTRITASIGIAMYPKDGTMLNELLKNADTAMYEAKSMRKNQYRFFQHRMYEKVSHQFQMENDLRNAVIKEEFQIHYQPLIDAKTQKIAGVEALLRWHHPTKGIVPPGDFISLAEETGLINSIGEWVLDKVCKQLKLWHDAGHTHLYAAVNISITQLEYRGFLEMVKHTVENTGLNAKHLELELTESVLIKSLDSSINVLHQLKAMGLRLALDDFGTGYSSLNYLKRLPIDTLKIDKSFIDDIIESVDDTIIGEIIRLAHKFRLKVVAEGVETEEQYSFLRHEACDRIQGYYFAKPLPMAELTELLESEKGA